MGFVRFGFTTSISAPAADVRRRDKISYVAADWQVGPEAAVRLICNEWQFCPKRPCPAPHRERAPLGSNLGILGEGKSILHVDSKVADRIFDLAMAEQDLNSTKVAGGPIDY